MVKLDIEKLKFVLDHTPWRQNIMLMGKHGIGKSEILTEYYSAKGMKVIPLFVGQMSDPGDIIGLPNKDEETGRTEFMLPYWFPVDGKPIVLFLDELNRARPELLQVVMDLVLNRKIVGKALPEGSTIIAACNIGDEYTLTDMDPALISRFNTYEFEPTVNEWIKWGAMNAINDSVLGFIGMHDDMLDYVSDEGDDAGEKGVDRRSWKRVSDILNSNGFVKGREMKAHLSGIVGNKAGAAFYDYVSAGRNVSVENLLVGDGFDAESPNMKDFNVIQYTGLCDRVCAYIHRNSDQVKAENDKVAENVLKFMKHIAANCREIMGYLVQSYQSGRYSRFNVFMTRNKNVDEYINRFISEIEL